MDSVYVVVRTNKNGENNFHGVFSTQEKAFNYIKDLTWARGNSESDITEVCLVKRTK